LVNSRRRWSNDILKLTGNKQINIDNLEGLENTLSDLDLALLVFLRRGENLVESDEAALNLALVELGKKDIKINKIIVSEAGTWFESGVKQFGLKRMPAVVIIGKYGSVLFQPGKINPEEIIKASDQVNSPPKNVS